MAKRLMDTFKGDTDKQVNTILKILYAISDDGQYYFFEYGKDMLNRYIADNKKLMTLKSAQELVKKEIPELYDETMGFDKVGLKVIDLLTKNIR